MVSSPAGMRRRREEVSAKLELSVIIPTYNEEAAIRHTVEAVAAYLAQSRIPHEIIVADDGSTDRTIEVVRELARILPGIQVLRCPHAGKGAAVRRGVLEAQGVQVLFLDADHSTRIEEWEKLVPWLQDGYDVVIGSRKMAGAQVHVHQPPLREAMGKVFTWLTNRLLGVRVWDVTCGFKGYRLSAARAIFQRLRIAGWGFDAEALFVARRLGLRIKEVPVIWADDASTKVHLVKDAVRSFMELVAIRLGALRGWYS